MTQQAYNDQMDTRLIETKLREIKDLPTKVRSWEVFEGEDATSESAIWVWITLDRSDTSPSERAEIRQRVRDAVHAAANESTWVYVRFSDEVAEAKEA